MKKDNNDFEDDIIVTLTLEDDSEIDCQVVTIFEAAGREYIALLPTTGEDADEGTVYLYRYIESEDGMDLDSPRLEDIEDDDEYQIASDAFDEYLDSIEFDELVDDDDEDE